MTAGLIPATALTTQPPSTGLITGPMGLAPLMDATTGKEAAIIVRYNTLIQRA